MKQFRDTPYYVTEDGKVFRYYPRKEWINKIKGRNGKYYDRLRVKEERYTLLKSHQMKHGYCYCTLQNKSAPKNYYIHRLVAELYVPGYFEGAHVDHIDCNKLNNHYTNLQWCSKEYNRQKGNNPDYPLFCQIE